MRRPQGAGPTVAFSSRRGHVSVMDHALDRPAWSALTTRQAHLADGDGRAVRLHPDYGIFAAAADASEENLAALAALVPASGAVGTVEAVAHPPVPGVTSAEPAVLCQMLAGDLTRVAADGFEIVDLDTSDAPDMLALATLTRPGPFLSRTPELGDFVGVKLGGRLIAMAGERLNLPGFQEVSGVCVHPDHRGRGYAAALMSVVADRILARGDTPFLHVYADNVGAIALYQRLGYAIRRDMVLTILSRD